MDGPPAPGSALEKKFQELGLESTPEEFVESLSEPVRASVLALQNLQTEHETLETQFRKERAELEAKYEELYAPLYVKRTGIVAGTTPVEGAEGKGVPEFWLAVLLKCDTSADMIKDKDVEVLTHLTNIISTPVLTEEGARTGFKLTFTFNDNPYFTNKTLQKTYVLSPEDEGVLEKAEGTKIEWKAGKDVTIKIMKKKPKKGGKQDHKPQIKTEKVDSFFNFFSPPDVPGEDDEIEDEQMEELQNLIEADYEVGATIREKLIPHAVRWFTGEAIEDEPFEFGNEGSYDEDDEDEGDDEHDDDDEDDDESPPPKKGGKPGKKAVAEAGQAPGPDGQNPECKQQ
mmetsp:Transcript_13232/g.23289  ORF Transcript_13232/g.23289 Transcript_13232/m.23289 type:complete len:343 (-) Transcript_13232:605-1633(-)